MQLKSLAGFIIWSCSGLDGVESNTLFPGSLVCICHGCRFIISRSSSTHWLDQMLTAKLAWRGSSNSDDFHVTTYMHIIIR